MERLTKKIENEERYIANNFKREQGEWLFSAVENYNNKVYNKLGKLEDLLENADTIRIIKINGIASLHIDMILDNETYPIAEELFGKEKVVDYDK